MNIIKKATAAISLSLFIVYNALAAPADFIIGQDPADINAPAKGTLGQNITGIINWFLGILGLIAVGFLIYAGVLMVTAGGNEEQVSKSKKIITYAVIGLIVIILAYAIVTFVINSLG